MTRRPFHAHEAGTGVPVDRTAQAASVPADPDSHEPGHLHQQGPWLRWTVYLCAAIGMALAAFLLLRPPAPPGSLQSRPSPCGPYCR